jgi:vancomycin resistance protein YoaR
VGRRRLSAMIAAAVLGVLGVGYGAAYAFTGNKIPGDTTVLGIALGGLSQDEARAKLADAIKGRLDDPLKLTAGGKTYQVSPADAGLSVDVEATVSAAGAGRSLSPGRIWHVLTGGAPVEPVVTTDPGKLDAVVERLAKRIDRAPTEGSITFDTGSGEAKAVRHPPAEGHTLDTGKTADAIVAAYPSNGRPVALPVHRSKPKVNADALDKAMTEYAEPAMSGPIRLTVNDEGVTLTPKQIAPSLKLIVNGDGSYTPSLDMAKLEPIVKKKFEGIETLPKDATVEIRGGRPVVVPAVDGMVVARDKVQPAILATLPKPAGQRTASVGLTAKKASFTTEQASRLGVKEVIGAFTTYFPHAAYRNTNIGAAARKIDGTLLKPGEIFSLNEIVGERTAANGFTTGYIINNGQLVKDLGGGVSQSATTTFNAMFFAGFKDVQHKPHSFYISRYPEGREATVAWPSVDLKFQNDSQYGALVDTNFTASTPGSRGSITVWIWGTKTWDITAGKSARYNPKPAGTIYNDKPECEAHAPEPGFDVKVYRYFSRNGVRVRTETFTTHYNPADRVICGKNPDPKQTTPPPTPPPSSPPR